MDSIKIAILGHGTIGGGVSRILLNNQKSLEQKAGKKLDLVAICTKDPEPDPEFVKDYGHLFCEAEEVFQNPDIDIVCETIGGDGIALQFVKQALSAGKNVVTANKKMIAKHFEELQQIANAKNASLFFEAAVGGGIPVLSTIRSGLSGDEITSIEGILNGTTNYILTEMEKKGVDFSDALADAQLKGFAEADPTDDIEGFDVAYKLAILINLAFGQSIELERIPREGVSRLSNADFRYAARINKRVKLLGRAQRNSDTELSAEVGPVLLSQDSRIAQVDGVINAVNFIGTYNTVGNFVSGEGAGRFATAAAIVSDMVAIARNEQSHLPTLTPAQLQSNSEQAYYLRFLVNDRPGIVGDIGRIFGEHGVSIDAVEQATGQSEPVHFMVTTFPVEKAKFEAALAELNKADYNAEKPVVMPIVE
jgi:homoserine dehydrogenase